MSDWRLLYGPLDGTGTILGELPCIGMGYGDVLNGAGRWAATLPLDADPPRLVLPAQGVGPSTPLDAELVLLDRATLAPGRTQVWFERDGVLLASGVVWTAKADPSMNTLELAGEGMHSYFWRRFIRLDTTFTAIDQLEIARTLIEDAQALGNGNIGVTLDAATTGVLRDRTYLGTERKAVAEAIEQLAAVEGGFDFAYRPAWIAGVPTVRFVTTFPATGRITAEVFELGTNCSLLAYSEDGTSLANVVEAFGSGDGDDAVRTTAINGPLLGPYRQLEAVIAFSDVRELDTLDAHARRRLSRGAGPIRHVMLQTFPDSIPVLGSYEVGDVVTVRASHGWLDISGPFRIVSIDVNVTGGEETVKVALAGLEVFEPI